MSKATDWAALWLILPPCPAVIHAAPGLSLGRAHLWGCRQNKEPREDNNNDNKSRKVIDNERTGVALVYVQDFVIMFFKYIKTCSKGAECSCCPYRTRNDVLRCSAGVPIGHWEHLLTAWTVGDWSCAGEVCAVQTACGLLHLADMGDPVLWWWYVLKHLKSPPALFL